MKHSSAADLREFALAVLRASGMSPIDARLTAIGLLEASLRGVSTHGVFRLPQYSQSLRNGEVNPRPHLRVTAPRTAVRVVDADGGYGFRPGLLAMKLAVTVARVEGIGVVGVSNSHHFGAASFYTTRACRAGMIGVATTSTHAWIAPPGGRWPVVGNNPLSIGAPRPGFAPIILDMAMSATAMGRIRVAESLGREIPEGWGYDAAGAPTTDPSAVLNGGSLVPIGGYKGYGLALMLDVLAGVLTRSPFGPDADNHGRRSGGVGHLMLAIDPRAMGPWDTYAVGIEKLAQVTMGARGDAGEVFLPGDPEARAEDRNRAVGIDVEDGIAANLDSLAAELHVNQIHWTSGEEAGGD